MSETPPKATRDAGNARDPGAWIDRVVSLVVTWVPFAVAVSRLASASEWRDDLPAVRDLGLVSVGVGGGVSTIVAQALSLAPLGSRTFRAGFGAAIALAIAARLVYALTRGALARARTAPRLSPVLAGIAALTAALSPTWQREGTVGGGATIAVALALASLLVAQRATEPTAPARYWIGLGTLVGATLAESPAAGLAAFLGASVLIFAPRLSGYRLVLPARAPLTIGLICAVTVALLLVAPVALRPFAPRGWMDVGHEVSIARLSGFDAASARTTALSAWLREIGFVSLGIAAFGAGLGVVRNPLRAVVLPFITLVALDSLLPARAAGALLADPLASLRALAVAAIAIASAIGVQEVVTMLLRARVPLAKSAAVLVVIFHLTLVALTSEEAGFAADRSEQMAAETWTDGAMGRLPARTALLVRSPALAWRVWAARLVRGERPDVLLVPLPLLNRGRVAATLLANERSSEALLRDLALTGEPSELGLSTLADARPLRVELDRGWSKRLASHLLADGLWLQFAPQPFGISDRKVAARAGFPRLHRVIETIVHGDVPDVATATIVATSLRAQSSVLAQLGDDDLADDLLAQLEQVRAIDPTVSAMPMRYAIAGIKRAFTRRSPTRSPSTQAKR